MKRVLVILLLAGIITIMFMNTPFPSSGKCTESTTTIHSTTSVPTTLVKTTTKVKYTTTTVQFVLRNGGYIFEGIKTVGNTIEVIFVVRDWVPAPQVIIYRQFTISYPITMNPVIIGIAYHYNEKGYITRTETLLPGNFNFR